MTNEEITDLQLVFSINGQRKMLDIVGTEKNPVVMKIDFVPGLREIETA